jgi:hypothetical protein
LANFGQLIEAFGRTLLLLVLGRQRWRRRLGRRHLLQVTRRFVIVVHFLTLVTCVAIGKNSLKIKKKKVFSKIYQRLFYKCDIFVLVVLLLLDHSYYYF